MDIAHQINDLAGLQARYRPATDRTAAKLTDRIDDASARYIDRCPFLVLATHGADGTVDASPRGGPPGFLQRLDDRHVAIPDLNGNNLLDSYRNIVATNSAGVLLMVPGRDETLRINGATCITEDPGILAGFTSELKRPKTAIVVRTDELFVHCAKAFRRGRVWDPESWGALADAPDLAEIYSTQVASADEAEVRSMLGEVYTADLAED